MLSSGNQPESRALRVTCRFPLRLPVLKPPGATACWTRLGALCWQCAQGLSCWVRPFVGHVLSSAAWPSGALVAPQATPVPGVPLSQPGPCSRGLLFLRVIRPDSLTRTLRPKVRMRKANPDTGEGAAARTLPVAAHPGAPEETRGMGSSRICACADCPRDASRVTCANAFCVKGQLSLPQRRRGG